MYSFGRRRSRKLSRRSRRSRRGSRRSRRGSRRSRRGSKRSRRGSRKRGFGKKEGSQKIQKSIKKYMKKVKHFVKKHPKKVVAGTIGAALAATALYNKNNISLKLNNKYNDSPFLQGAWEKFKSYIPGNKKSDQL